VLTCGVTDAPPAVAVTSVIVVAYRRRAGEGDRLRHLQGAVLGHVARGDDRRGRPLGVRGPRGGTGDDRQGDQQQGDQDEQAAGRGPGGRGFRVHGRDPFIYEGPWGAPREH
jgi:hypothetical protein